MKKTLKLTVVAVFTALITSCGYLTQKTDPQGYSRAITADGVKPLHIGTVTPRRAGAYHAQVYTRSVVFKATTTLVRPSQVEVFDLDHNGHFDVVYLFQNGTWSIGFTREFRSKNKTIESTISTKIVEEWVQRAAEVKRSTRAVSKKPAQRTNKATAPQPRPQQTQPRSESIPKTDESPPIQMGVWE